MFFPRVGIALLLAILIFPMASAVRISPDSISIVFEPNFQRDYVFSTEKADRVVQVEGALAQYVTVVQDDIKEEGTFVVRVKLPEQIETPGDNLVFISLTEAGRDAGMIGGVARIRTPIVIRVPYPGSYANLAFSMHNVNVNETGNFLITADNRGQEDTTINAIITLVRGNTVLNAFPAEQKTVKKGTIGYIGVPFNPAPYSPGPYRAWADITYGEKSKRLESSFFIGALKVDILSYSTSFRPHKINKVDIAVESRWNTPIDNIFADITVTNGTSLIGSTKTPSTSLPPLGKSTLQGFWDATEVGEGNYTMALILHYDGALTTASTKITVENDNRPVEEKTFFATVNWTIVSLAAAVVLLILLNIIVLLRRRSA